MCHPRRGNCNPVLGPATGHRQTATDGGIIMSTDPPTDDEIQASIDSAEAAIEESEVSVAASDSAAAVT